MIEARVMEIERFALKDGPGIRTVVFLQGCPLHCPWCSNPESQDFRPLLMHMSARCTGCGSCISACPSGCIAFPDGKGPVIDRSRCAACGRCTDACPSGAMRITPMLTDCDNVVATVLRDKDYYDRSGGGVTFSGGEAMMQGRALTYMLGKCREAGLHTAVETCGNVPRETMEAVIPLTDLFLFDLKHCDAEKLREVTGGELALILANLKLAAEAGKVRLRIPCIPGFNLDSENFDKSFSTALELGIGGIDLLAYHTLGTGKYVETGREYAFPEKALDRSLLEPYAETGRKLGLDIKIY